MRAEEALSLNIEDIDEATKTAVVVGKGGQLRPCRLANAPPLVVPVVAQAPYASGVFSLLSGTLGGLRFSTLGV